MSSRTLTPCIANETYRLFVLARQCIAPRTQAAAECLTNFISMLGCDCNILPGSHDLPAPV